MNFPILVAHMHDFICSCSCIGVPAGFDHAPDSERVHSSSPIVLNEGSEDAAIAADWFEKNGGGLKIRPRAQSGRKRKAVLDERVDSGGRRRVDKEEEEEEEEGEGGDEEEEGGDEEEEQGEDEEEDEDGEGGQELEEGELTD